MAMSMRVEQLKAEAQGMGCLSIRDLGVVLRV